MIQRNASDALPTASEIEQDPWKTRLKWALSFAVVALLVAIALRALDFRQVGLALAGSDWRLVAGAGAVAVTICILACSVRLYLVTQPLPARSPIGFAALTSIYYASCAAHQLLPAPAAEVLRTVQLKRRHGYSIGALIASQVVERVIEALALALEVGFVAAVGTLPRSVHGPLWGFAALTAAGVAGLVIVALRHRPGELAVEGEGVRARLAGLLRRLSEGVYLLRDPRRWALSLGCSLVNDLANAATVGLCLAAVGVGLPVASWFVVVLVARLAGLLPSTPGQFGVVEAGIVLALAALGVDRNRALAVALLYHLAHFVPITAVGLWELRKHWGPAIDESRERVTT
jgi:uncharacterized membrane protein YbhN (UPF0104 family)